jgi:hypothetical protein
MCPVIVSSCLLVDQLCFQDKNTLTNYFPPRSDGRVYKDDHILTSFVLQTKVNFAAAKTLKRRKPSYYSSPSLITKYLHPVQRKGKLSLSNMETKGIKDQRKDLINTY